MSWLTQYIWPLVRDVGEEKAKAEVVKLVAEVNEEAGQWLQGEGSERLRQLLFDADVPEELWPVLAPAIIAFACAAVEKPLQKAVNDAWAEVEKINPGDRPDPVPVVDLDGV